MGATTVNTWKSLPAKSLPPILATAILATAGLALGALSAPARATTIDYSLNDYVGSGRPSLPAPYGTVALTSSGSNVDVTLTLASGVGLVHTGAGYSLTWDLTGDPAITVSGQPSGFSLVTNVSASGSGSWDYGLKCSVSTCGHGGSSPYTTPLSFTIDNVTLADFTTNGNGHYFSSDVCIGVTSSDTCGGGITGVITGGPATVTPPPSPSSAPEPASSAGLMVLALGLLGATRFLGHARR